jgi:hypothetical protein
MRALSLAALLALVVSVPAVPQTGGRQPAADTGTIRGVVRDSDTGRPIRRAQVSIARVNPLPGVPPISVSSDSQGRFEARDVPDGAYHVTASRAGYLRMQYGQRTAGERGLTVEVGGGAIEVIDIVLPRAGILSGRIIDDLGEPYPGVRVDALAMRYTLGQRQPSPAGVAITDDLGNFRIAGLAPGTYHIAASTTETWRTEKNETFGYATTFYPGGAIDQAQAVTLEASEHRRDLDFSLQAIRAARIRGRVQRENGEPAAGASVPLAYSYPGSVMTAGMRMVRTAADGSFEFRDVPGGTYSVGGGNAEQIVTVAGEDIDGILLTPRTGSQVSGVVTTDEGTAPPFPVSGVRVLLEAPARGVLPTVRVVQVEADWSFALRGLGGPFLFRLMGLPDGWMVRSVHRGDTEITDAAWDVPTGGRTFSDLRIEVTQQVGRLSGSVVEASGAPTSSATVLVFADDEMLWYPYSRFTRTARPSADGRFRIERLAAGRYLAVARAYVEDGQWDDRSFLASLRDDAEAFTLSEGGSHALTLRLPPRQRLP